MAWMWLACSSSKIIITFSCGAITLGERLATVARAQGMLLMGCDQCCYERGIAESLVDGAVIGCFPNLCRALAPAAPDHVISL